MFVIFTHAICLFVCWFISYQDYTKTAQPISMKSHVGVSHDLIKNLHILVLIQINRHIQEFFFPFL